MEAKVKDWHTEISLTPEDVKLLCKPGQGDNTCIWLVAGPSGFECVCKNRPIALIKRWEAGLTSAKRDGCDVVNEFDPTGLFGEKVSIPYDKDKLR